jgi:hypothetical protein
MAHYMMALKEVLPAFGIDNKSLENSIRGGFYIYGPKMEELYTNCSEFINSVKNSQNT